MTPSPQKTRLTWRRWVAAVLAIGAVLLVAFFVFVNTLLEPILRDRLQVLIVQGSDSLYTYRLGDLRANFFGGSVEVHDLSIDLNVAKYNQLKAAKALPSLTMQVNLKRGYIKGVGVMSLLFAKKIKVNEIYSGDADVRLLRHLRNDKDTITKPPLWKAIRPSIASIEINSIRLAGIKMLYKDLDTVTSAKLQFDTCNAVFKNIIIDSAAAADPNRIGFAKSIDMQFRDLKFRTADSTYKMKAEAINYSSDNKTFEVTAFKLQPTLKDKADFYRGATQQQTMNVIEFGRMRLTNFRLDRFLNNNSVVADSVLFDDFTASMYNDRTLPPTAERKFRKDPHQKLLTAGVAIAINGVRMSNFNLAYTEKAKKTSAEGTVRLERMNITVSNVTNVVDRIYKNNVCTAVADGLIMGSPLQAKFRFFLDSTDGQFAAEGAIKNLTAKQVNPLSESLANTTLQSFDLKGLQFNMQGDIFGATANVRMQYNNLFVVLRKKDEETGVLSTKKFLTKIINKFTLQEQNPGPDGVERVANNVLQARVSNVSFFGFVWKTIYAGMQRVMVKSGSVS